MAIIRRQDIYSPFRELEERFNQLLGTQGSRETLALSDWSPSCDVSENGDAYVLRAELPSVDKKDVRVTLEDGVLTIEGERKTEEEQKDEKYHRRELSYGRFVRSFNVPDDADADKVEAKYKDGLLKVTIAKSESVASKPKQISIH